MLFSSSQSNLLQHVKSVSARQDRMFKKFYGVVEFADTSKTKSIWTLNSAVQLISNQVEFYRNLGGEGVDCGLHCFELFTLVNFWLLTEILIWINKKKSQISHVLEWLNWKQSANKSLSCTHMHTYNHPVGALSTFQCCWRFDLQTHTKKERTTPACCQTTNSAPVSTLKGSADSPSFQHFLFVFLHSD